VFFSIISTFVIAQTTIQVGWNLVGNGMTEYIAPSSIGSSSSVTSIWKWNATTSNWAFYSPQQSDGGVSYAAANGFTALTAINGGEGFWINAKQSFTLNAGSGAVYTSSLLAQGKSGALSTGWNLVSVGDTITASSFNANLGSSKNSSGFPTNLTSLWAWDATKTQWYFYSPALEAQGSAALSAYAKTNGYEDFASLGKSLGSGVGFWVNMPSATSASCSSGTSQSSNTKIQCQNMMPVTQNLQDYTTAGSYDYGSASIVFGKFGSSTANCFLTQTVTRGILGSSPTYPDGPTYVYCQQSDGSFKEVSQQLFGQQLAVNGGYPLVADFNGDGIDDVFLVQSWDGAFPNDSSNVYTLISQSNGGYKIIKNNYEVNIGLNQTTAVDINQDGCLDVVSANSDIFINDCSGNFVFKRSLLNWSSVALQIPGPSCATNVACPGFKGQYSGESIASADFLGKGYSQILIGSAWKSDPDYPNAVIDVDKNFNVIGLYKLPTPYFTKTLGQGTEDDAVIRIIDINNDGKPDILINSTNFFYASANQFSVPSLTKILVYLNTGNGSFTDISSSALPGFDMTQSGGFFNHRIIDINGDGYMDIVLDGASYGTSVAGNQVWINNKDNTFHSVFTSELETISNNFTSQFGLVPSYTIGEMLPIKVNNAWNFILHIRDHKNQYHDGVANTQFTFK